MGIPFAPFLALGALIALFFGRSAARRVSEPLLALSFRAGVLPIPRSRDSMDLKRPNKLRLSGTSGAGEDRRRAPTPALHARFPVNEVAELVADLIEATGLLAGDKLAAVRGRVKQGGSFAQALLDEGVGLPEGIARTLASRFHLPFVDLPLTGVDEEAAERAPAPRARARDRHPVRARGRHAAGRGRRPRQRARDRRAAARDALPARARGRLARGHRERDPPPGRAPPRPSALAPRSTRRTGSSRRPRRRSRRPRGRRRHLRRARSSGSSTRSSSRPPRTGPATSTSSRRRTRSSSGSASTACCTRCSGSRSG